MSLTDRAIINLKASAKPNKHFDSGGLFIYVPPTRKKYWKLWYRFHRKPKTLVSRNVSEG